jgi:hypothetical protein
MAKKIDGRGGRREGAGRKRVVQNPKNITVAFEQSDLDALQDLAMQRNTSATALIRTAVAQYLRRSERK